jgi:hypothetical protein
MFSAGTMKRDHEKRVNEDNDGEVVFGSWKGDEALNGQFSVISRA